MNSQKEKYAISTFWTGTCPECALKGEKARMRLNSWDFYECEKSKLQIVLTAPNVLATILKFRGKGEFRIKAEYADDLPRNEILCRQTLENFPFTDNELFKSGEEIEKYLLSDVDKN